MTFVLLSLRVHVKWFFNFSFKEGLIFVFVFFLLSLFFIKFSLSLLLKLVGQGDKQILFPNLELSIQGWCIFYACEETFVFVWKLTHLFQFSLHFEHNFFFLLRVHSVEIQILSSDSFVFILDKSICTHVNKSFSEILFRKFNCMPIVVVIFFCFIGRCFFFKELFFTQSMISRNSSKGFPRIHWYSMHWPVY